LLGDPAVLILDEPLNGLDPDGIRWMRGLLRQLAADGRTILVSSHLLAEAAQTVQDVVVISHGRLAAEGPVTELIQARHTDNLEDLFFDLTSDHANNRALEVHSS
jgi:ABC-2 type transport system ATP-binding protein